VDSGTIWQPEQLWPVGPSAPALAGHGAQAEGEIRPFGLRYLSEAGPGSSEALDAAVTFDPERQISVVDDDGVVVPAFKRTNGQTNTTTNVHDRQESDSDTDYEEDR
jgi:putative ATP-grasp target RiPP